MKKIKFLVSEADYNKLKAKHDRKAKGKKKAASKKGKKKTAKKRKKKK